MAQANPVSLDVSKAEENKMQDEGEGTESEHYENEDSNAAANHPKKNKKSAQGVEKKHVDDIDTSKIGGKRLKGASKDEVSKKEPAESGKKQKKVK